MINWSYGEGRGDTKREVCGGGGQVKFTPPKKGGGGVGHADNISISFKLAYCMKYIVLEIYDSFCEPDALHMSLSSGLINALH